MEDQLVSSPQNPHQLNNIPADLNTHPQQKTGLLFPVLTTILVSAIVIGLIGYYLWTQLTKTDSSSPIGRTTTSSSPVDEIQPSVAQQSNDPELVAFMRDGEIWIKDYQTNTENKISSSNKVGGPNFSPDAKYLTYFEIIHASGGFPTYSLYVSDRYGQYEKSFDMGTNYFSSKLKWSQDGKLLGLILIDANENFKEKAYVYDPVTKREVLIGILADRQTGDDSAYSVNLSCQELEASYVSFCNEYVSYISKDTESDYASSYQWDEFLQSKYTKQGYKLTRSEKLDNGLVVLEYFTGEAQNPEASWGIGGGSFIPGYDKGVKQTYTVLLDELSGVVLDEIDKAIESDFFFGSHTF